MNELLLTGSIALYYALALVAFFIFKKSGLFFWIVFATITANIEVMILVKAFGMEQTLGNIMFASSFLITDILSELYGKKEANKAVWIGTATSFCFILVSQYWLLFEPAIHDTAMPSMVAIFSKTPRIMIAGLVAYVISQRFDVWLYHTLWKLTETKSGSHKAFLWLRNNGSTLVSQLLNTLMFTSFAFWGVYPTQTLIAIFISTYAIYFIASLIDTPFLYLARYFHEKQKAL